MRVRPGGVAPSFQAVALDGSPVAETAAGAWTLISFLRYASCPMCNLRVRELTLRTSEMMSHQVKWVAVFHSPAHRLARRMDREALSRVVADPSMKLYALFGVRRSWWGMLISVLLPSFYWNVLRAGALGYWGGAIDGSVHSMPADFLVSPDGVVRLAHYGIHIGDHVDVTTVVNSVQDYVEAVAVPAASR